MPASTTRLTSSPPAAISQPTPILRHIWRRSSSPAGSRCAISTSRKRRSPISKTSRPPRSRRYRAPAPPIGRRWRYRRATKTQRRSNRSPSPPRSRPRSTDVSPSRCRRTRHNRPHAQFPNHQNTTPREDIEDLVQASATLLRVGDVRRANVFANAAIDFCQSTACVTSLSARLSRLGNTYGALRSAKKAQTLGVARPDQLYPLIDLPPACTTAGVPPALILALIRQESEFDPAAVSNANARGLLQLLPSTAQDVARRYGLARPSANDLLKPETNLAIGCYHVKDLLDALDGSWVLTIAGYNAGKARVLGWTTAHGDPRDAKVDVIDWIEAIPFDETRNYVMRVLENHLAYKTRRNEPLQPQELSRILRPAP